MNGAKHLPIVHRKPSSGGAFRSSSSTSMHTPAYSSSSSTPSASTSTGHSPSSSTTSRHRPAVQFAYPGPPSSRASTSSSRHSDPIQNQAPAHASSSSATTSNVSSSSSTTSAGPPAPSPSPTPSSSSTSYDISAYSSTDLLKLLASLLTQIAATNDALTSSSSSSSSSSPTSPHPPSTNRSPRSSSFPHSSSSSHPSTPSSSSATHHNQRQHPPIWYTLTTASRTALSTPTSTLTFHARNIPSISLEAYLLRILKYCPTTNHVFLSLLVYFDRMARLSGEIEGDIDEDAEDEFGSVGTHGIGDEGDRDVEMRGGSVTGDSSTKMDVDTDLSASAVAPPRKRAKRRRPQRSFVIDSYNIHRLVIAGVTVASKFFSDVFYTNGRYAKVGGLPLHELNQLELQFLLLNDFRLVISGAEMQRYAEQLILFSKSQSNPIVLRMERSLGEAGSLNGSSYHKRSGSSGSTVSRDGKGEKDGNKEKRLNGTHSHHHPSHSSSTSSQSHQYSYAGGRNAAVASTSSNPVFVTQPQPPSMARGSQDGVVESRHTHVPLPPPPASSSSHQPSSSSSLAQPKGVQTPKFGAQAHRPTLTNGHHPHSFQHHQRQGEFSHYDASSDDEDDDHSYSERGFETGTESGSGFDTGTETETETEGETDAGETDASGSTTSDEPTVRPRKAYVRGRRESMGSMMGGGDEEGGVGGSEVRGEGEGSGGGEGEGRERGNERTPEVGRRSEDRDVGMDVDPSSP
ncbi:hypothetical protein CC1G_14555 [Coprinopsis cinerea okayama7|uniref:Cyclin-domain-containing protein n=1 Tax=Coprinopsis cinerea (strain Okayama-7 / 130 / ATCC MYA-4618 / FGSC 9003) TaxID=240176 RepID=D6RMG1_COPC7|nr:hypothetical protein CC1G_14555 [Coprinopsis cinerea okayama7\|eukprot:XP_002911123.1 hypothetical protein CC1G_14555 [Coprinopsis cinerea okayama7\